MRVLQLVSSPFLFVYLAAQLRGGDPAAGEADSKCNALWEIEYFGEYGPFYLKRKHSIKFTI